MGEPNAAGSRRIRVSTTAGSAAGYDVVVERGALARLGASLERCPGRRFAIIADQNVAEAHGAQALAAVSSVTPADLFTFPSGEASKTRATWTALTDALLAAGFGRDGCVIALGGGVTGDLAGFVAATFMRGVPWVQLPTSLLAMIDASIGGKTGIDVPAGKNLVGAFHHPLHVVIDPATLDTLPPAELRQGLAEAVKHGAIADAGHLAWIEAHAADLANADAGTLDALIEASVAIKAAIVSADPEERGQRAILNFGHTIAHAIERTTAFAVPHGQAVAIGMVAEARIGEAAALTEPGTAARLAALLTSLGLPVQLPAGLSGAALLEAAATDKKARASRLRYALLARPGEPARGLDGEWTVEIADETVAAALDA